MYELSGTSLRNTGTALTEKTVNSAVSTFNFTTSAFSALRLSNSQDHFLVIRTWWLYTARIFTL